jgi:hypothetical protein
MEISISNPVNTFNHTVANKQAIGGLYAKFIESLTPYYFGLIAFTITFGSILGGITAMYVSQNNAPVWHMSICIAAAMANNVMAIGQAPIKWVMATFVITKLIELALIIVNFA